MTEYISLFEVLTLTGALIGLYLKMTQEIGKLKSRIAMLEKQEVQIMTMLEKLVTTCDEIKLILAKEGLR